MNHYLALSALAFASLSSACGRTPAAAQLASASSSVPIIDFERDSVQVLGALRAGQPATLHYAAERLPCVGDVGDGAYSATAKAYIIVDNQAQFIGALTEGGGVGSPVTKDLTFTVPNGVTQLALYVEASSYGDVNGGQCHSFDSNNGANWLFPVK